MATATATAPATKKGQQRAAGAGDGWRGREGEGAGTAGSFMWVGTSRMPPCGPMASSGVSATVGSWTIATTSGSCGMASPGRAVWADLGSGEGAFTLALAELLGPGGAIHSVDLDGRALHVQLLALHDAFPDVDVTQLVGDFTMPLDLPPLDGIVMANSLHFVRDKLPVLRLVRGYLRPTGRLVLVEYDTDRGNRWVPFPLSFRSWDELAAQAGFHETRRLASVPSRFLESIYSAVSLVDGPNHRPAGGPRLADAQLPGTTCSRRRPAGRGRGAALTPDREAG